VNEVKCYEVICHQYGKKQNTVIKNTSSMLVYLIYDTQNAYNMIRRRS